MLGQWEEAAKDLHLASKLDYDEEIYNVLKKVLVLPCSSQPHSVLYILFHFSKIFMFCPHWEFVHLACYVFLKREEGNELKVIV